MPKMRAVQVPRAKAPFEIVEREVPEPGSESVRIKVQACGICHSDTITREGTFPLERVAEAYDRMLSGHARFRVDLTTNS